MTAAHAGWDLWLARLHYLIGGAYYAKGWLISLGPALGLSPFLAEASPIARTVPVCVGIALTAWGSTVWVTAYRRRRASANPDLRLGPIEESLHVLGGDRYISARRVTVAALRTGVAHYDDKFSWTGGGTVTCGFTLPADGRIVIRPQYMGPHQVARIEFARPLNRGETVDIDYTLHLTDLEKTAQPFLSFISAVPVSGTLTLRAVFQTTAPAAYKKQLFLSAAAETPTWERVEAVRPGSSELLWSVPRLRPDYRYQISWSPPS